MITIKSIKNKKELKELFNFLSEVFYDEAKECNENYFPMTERFDEMKKQFKKAKDLLMFIEDNNQIIAGLTAKKMNLENKQIGLGMIAVHKNYRGQGYGKKLVKEFEHRCKEKNIHHINIGARYRACDFYTSLNYKPTLMVQVFDFVSIDAIRNANVFNLEEIKSAQKENYGWIFFKVNETDEKYIEFFEKNVKTANALYVFEKDL